MSEKGGSFGKEWQLMKLSRTWKPYNISDDLLKIITEGGNYDTKELLKEAAYHKGQRLGGEFVSKMPDKNDRVVILETFFLISGISYRIQREESKTKIQVEKDAKKLVTGNWMDESTYISFFSGFIGAITKGASIYESENIITVIV